MKFNELIEFLRSCTEVEQIDEKREEIAELIPEVESMFGFDQKQKSQEFDLWTHSIKSVVLLPKDLPDDRPNNLLFLAALLHDIGKPQTQVPDKKKPEFMSYPDHPKKAREILEKQIIPRLNASEQVLDKDDIRCLLYYVEHHHDQSIRVKRFVRKQVTLSTLEQFLNMLRLQIADCKAQYKCSETVQRVDFCDYILKKGEKDFTSLLTASQWLM